MASPRTFRFGMQLSNASSGDEWSSLARKVEDLGYSTLFLPDHFGDQLAPLPAMMAAADATNTLRVGALVHDNDYKHPVVLAKEIATVDVLSGGRVEFGIGAGWMNTDYEQSGIPKDRDGVRIARMAEALQIYKGVWAEGPFSFSGAHYEVTGLDGQPKPHQPQGPPILIGGGGPKVLGIAGRFADIVGINPALPAGEVTLAAGPEMLAAAVDRKLGYVRGAAGDRFEQIELNVLVFFGAVTDNRATQVTNYAGLLGMEPEDFDGSPYFAFFGSVEEIADNLRAARERWGISYYCFQAAAMEEMAPVVALLAGT